MKEVYLVLFTIAFSVPTECPDYVPDKYGRYPLFHCSVYHSRTEERRDFEVFETKEDAIKFIKENATEKLAVWGLHGAIVDSIYSPFGDTYKDMVLFKQIKPYR